MFHGLVDDTKEQPTDKDLGKVTVLVGANIGETKDIQTRLSSSTGCFHIHSRRARGYH
jgi:hypothetical protein